MEKRKIIQITAVGFADPHGGYWSCKALCNDGSLWDYDYILESWNRLPDIPQDDEQASK